MLRFQLSEHPHRRLNPLTGEWVLVSPHRMERPWLGQREEGQKEALPSYDPGCYLCPGNQRAGGVRNPQYASTFVFQNDFPSLLPDTPAGEVKESDLLLARSERGLCLVVCFSPRHDLTLAQMTVDEIASVVEAWAEQYAELVALPFINHVQVFENKGAMMGCSNPHPHGQIWATEHIPAEAEKELVRQRDYLERKASCLLCDYLALEVREGERIVCANEDFVVLVPFWACWPFETLVLPRRHLGRITELASQEKGSLADVLLRLTVRYDNLFETSFPYSAGWHQSPSDGSAHAEWHLHGHFYPPLLRSATVRKFMVGFEMLGNPQRDITPETAAERLRRLAEVHYRSAHRGE